MKTFILGTRGSELARAQTRHVLTELRRADAHPEILERVIHTTGDKRLDVSLSDPGSLDKGLFTKELEEALLANRIDAAVHSLKDLPTVQPPGLCIGAILERENPADVLVSKSAGGLDGLPPGAVVGTSSLRRKRFLEWKRPDLKIVEIRGNVPTRIRKLVESDDLAALVLAGAGIQRLEAAGCELHLDECQLSRLDFILPAPGQGAIAVECRTGDDATLSLLAEIDNIDTATCVAAERGVLAELGGGCHMPLGTRATIRDTELTLTAFWFPREKEAPATGTVRSPASEWMNAASKLAGVLKATR